MAVTVLLWDGARGEWVEAQAEDMPNTPWHVCYSYWSGSPNEAQVGQMQDHGPDPTARGGFAAYSEWLRLVNPETPRRD